MNVRIFWVRVMKCMCAQTRPRFILSSKRVFRGMEFEPMLTPREKSPLPENVPRGGSNPRRCGQRAQALPTELFRPPRYSINKNNVGVAAGLQNIGGLCGGVAGQSHDDQAGHRHLLQPERSAHQVMPTCTLDTPPPTLTLELFVSSICWLSCLCSESLISKTCWCIHWPEVFSMDLMQC